MLESTEYHESGMQLNDLLQDAEFMGRQAGARNSRRESIALRRLAKVFSEEAAVILRDLVEVAVEFCGADSAGISLEELQDRDNPRFRWIAVAGSFKKYLNGTTPRQYSPCGTCLNSGRPQHYRVSQPYYDYLGVEAEPILDGLLIPWENDVMRGTIWAVSHRSPQTFDRSDYEFLNGLADFVSLAIQNQGHQNTCRDEDRQAGGTVRANELAHAINNPLQCITNSLYLARQGGEASVKHVDQAAQDLKRLSQIVAELLRMRDC